MRVEFRPAIASDVDALAALERENFASDRISRSSFRRLLSRPSAAIVVARSGKQLAGYCLILFRSGSAVARLYSIAVSGEFAGAGLGRALLAEAEDAAARRGCHELRLEVRTDNRRAQVLYEKAGYVLFDTRDSYYSDGLAALRFRKALAPRHGQPGRNRSAELGTAR